MEMIAIDKKTVARPEKNSGTQWKSTDSGKDQRKALQTRGWWFRPEDTGRNEQKTRDNGNKETRALQTRMIVVENH